MDNWNSKCEVVESPKEKKSAAKGSTSSSSSNVKSSANKVYFYSDVSDKSLLNFQEELDKVVSNLYAQAAANRTDPAPVYLHINSFGGQMMAGFAAIDIIERCPLETISVVEGKAASAATLMSLAADKRLMTPHSLMLIHQLSSGSWGTYENFKDRKQNVDLYMKMIYEFYVSKTKIPKKVLKGLLKHDLYFDAKMCLKHGMVDGLYRG